MIDIFRQEELKGTQIQTQETDNSSECKRTKNRETNQKLDNTDDNGSNNTHMRTQYSVQGTQSRSQTNNTQTQSDQPQMRGSMWREEGLGKGEDETDGQSYKRPIRKKVQWWDVH